MARIKLKPQFPLEMAESILQRYAFNLPIVIKLAFSSVLGVLLPMKAVHMMGIVFIMTRKTVLLHQLE